MAKGGNQQPKGKSPVKPKGKAGTAKAGASAMPDEPVKVGQGKPLGVETPREIRAHKITPEQRNARCPIQGKGASECLGPGVSLTVSSHDSTIYAVRPKTVRPEDVDLVLLPSSFACTVTKVTPQVQETMEGEGAFMCYALYVTDHKLGHTLDASKKTHKITGKGFLHADKGHYWQFSPAAK